ncbi:MAG: FlgD immunoglobulin-like domain containing protein [bacterium]
MKRRDFCLLGIVLLITHSFAQDTPRKLYVLNGLAQTVSVMNLETEQIMNDVVKVGDIPGRIYARGERIYVVNSVPAGITVINGRTEQIEMEISLTDGSNPWALAFVGTTKAYVTNLVANTITVVDLATGDSLETIEVGEAPEGILVVGNTAYVANTGGFPDYTPSTLSVIDITTDVITKTLQVPMNPQDLALAPDGNIHVVCTGNFVDVFGKVAVVDPFGDTDFTALVVDTLEIGGSPGDIVVTADSVGYLPDFGDETGGFLYRYNAFTRTVERNATNPILVGKGAMNLLFDGRTGQLWVSNFAEDAVQLLDAADGGVVNTFDFGDGAQAMAILEPFSESDPWADLVASFTPGEGAGFGENFFPDNVLGPPDPDPTLTEFNPSAKPQEILSLGTGGEITLEFQDNVIVDRDGPDFTVFENVFLNVFDDNKPFLEAAFVAVSMDGENFVTFPADTATFEGFAGVTPTLDNLNPTNPEVSGGDSFDLADLGLPLARFVRLTDLGTVKQEGPFNGDFDLDAVVAINSEPAPPASVAAGDAPIPTTFSLSQNYPNPFNPETRIDFELSARTLVQIEVFNLAGQVVATLVDGAFEAGKFSTRWNGTDKLGRSVASGVYLYQMRADDSSVAKRLILLR